MASKLKKAPAGAPLSVEDDERHSDQVDDYISRNRDALNESIRKSRKELAEGKVSKKSISDIIAEGRRRHGGH
jgi:predicted RNase H-like nuclease (RuvC/YqgF family)